jgi:deoxyribodipyrimidine photolyase-related protein
MTLYADGGLLTTKPYIASSNYIRKMSDFKAGAWCDTFDALFWNFVGMHFEQLQKEGRLGFIGVQYSKMTAEKKESYRKRAQDYLDSME